MAYQQTLYKIIEPIKKTTISRLNKGKKWEYGYNPDYDFIVISKTGKIGQIIEIQNLRIALPIFLTHLLYLKRKQRLKMLAIELD